MSLTSVPGLRVGHGTVPGGGSGCTVVLGPFRAAADVRGLATGSREMDVLSPEHLVPRVDALFLTGGSAFGLGAAEGVVAWLRERGVGYATRVAPVPIVPGLVIYDLAEGRGRPSATEGRAAAEAAHDGPVETGRVGAGAGALVGKLAGVERASPGGLGSAAVELGPYVVGALAVVNALGDVLDGEGRILAGARGDDGSFLDSARLLVDESARGELEDLAVPGAGENTTLAVVATDAPLSQVDLARMARVASTALPRRISPVNTPFDGDATVVLSTAEATDPVDSGTVLALGVAGRDALEAAIEGAVA